MAPKRKKKPVSDAAPSLKKPLALPPAPSSECLSDRFFGKSGFPGDLPSGLILCV